MSSIMAIYKRACPNCHGEIRADRLIKGLPCRKCLPSIPLDYKGTLKDKLEILKNLENTGALKDYKEHITFLEKYNEAISFIEDLSKTKLWSTQKTWIKRILKKKSFPINIPTKSRKTFFIVNVSLYLAQNNENKIYILLPTKVQVDQIYMNIYKMRKNNKKIAKIRAIKYHPSLSKSDKTKFFEILQNKNFDVLITTAQFLENNFSLLTHIKFDYVFVDDINSILETSKGVDKLLYLIGFSKEIIGRALELIRLKINLKRSIRTGTTKEQITALKSKINDLSKEIRKAKEDTKVGQIIVSSAPTKPKGLRVKLFRELLGFNLGGIKKGIRKVLDTYIIVPDDRTFDKHLLDLVKKSGNGGLIFVPEDKGIDEVNRIEKFLRDNKINARAFHKDSKGDIIDLFAKGKIDILVGIASKQGRIIKEIDLPERVRYAIFMGIPRCIYNLKDVKISPSTLIIILKIIGEATGNTDLIKKARKLRDKLKQLDYTAIKTLTNSIEKDEPVEGVLEGLKKEFMNTSKKVLDLIKKPIIRKNISEYPYARIKEYNGGISIVYPDIISYIQASGRTSRLFPGGVTRGLSMIICSDQALINSLKRQLFFRYEDADLIPYNEIDINKIFKEIDEDRDFVKQIYQQDYKRGELDPIKTAIFVVESPIKAKTIARYFGTPVIYQHERGIKTYEVNIGKYIINIMPTHGHIFDLVKSVGHQGVIYEDGKFIPVYDTVKKCKSCNSKFVEGDSCPNCGSTDFIDSIEILKQLQDLAKEGDYLIFAFDPDIEGEKIAWDININMAHLLNNQLRLEFHEVSRSAVDNSLNEPENINTAFTKAQIVRRIENNWLNFGLEQKLLDMFGQAGLSTGRLQSVLLKWIINRYEDWKRDLHYYYRIEFGGFSVVIDYPQIKTITEGNTRAKKLLSAMLIIDNVRRETKILQPKPPYTTDTMLVEAAEVLKLSPSETMKLAQDLFEAGLITFHKTDSVRISQQGFKIAKAYISQKYGEGEYLPRQWGYLGTYECIRPVRPIDKEHLIDLLKENVIKTVKKITQEHISLYNLIFRRFIASQMYPATIELQKITGRIEDKPIEIEGVKQIIKSGYLKEYDLNVPPKIQTFNKKQTFKVNTVKQWLGASVKLFTQAELISEMKKKGIGNPSIYANVIKDLFERKYVEEENGWIKPTLLGVRVGNYIASRYRNIVSEERIKAVCDTMKKIQDGQIDYQKVIKEIFGELNEILQEK